MKTLYFECNMGAAGDMLTAALFELMPDQEAALRELNSIGLPGVLYTAEKTKKCGILGTRMLVTVSDMEEGADHAHEHDSHGDHAHFHGSMHEIRHIIDRLSLPDAVKRDVNEIYTQIAEAESSVHGVPVTEVHFHELGMMDAIADIVGTALLLHRLGIGKILASPVCTGYGTVKCAHGTVPVPTPATALLLEGIPTYAGDHLGELCTPTGAAILRYYVSEFLRMPPIIVQKIGYGMGKKDFDTANCVRAFLSAENAADDSITELVCNLDDMTGEAITFAQERLMEEGALDAFTTAIGMKKGRTGTMLTCLCRREQREQMIALIFRHTTTLGIRETECKRSVLSRRTERKQTEFGAVRLKYSEGYGVHKVKAEYEDIARIARDRNLTLAEVTAVLNGKN